MENNTNIYIYLWERLPLILMFANGYLIYRLFVVTKLTDTFVFRSLEKSQGRFHRLCLQIIMSAVLLSFFIPNAVTVLILLPVLKTIEKDIAPERHGAVTALTLSAIYGANIGGMGSLIGSPANLLLIGALDLYGVPGRDQISFFNWFIWSVPLVTLFAAAAYGLVMLVAVPKDVRGLVIRLKGGRSPRKLPAEQISGAFLFLIFLGFWISESILKGVVKAFGPFDTPLCLGFFLFFLWAVFIRPPGPCKKAILSPGQLLTGLPKRGILFLCLLVLIISGVRLFQLDKWVSDLLLSRIQPDTSFFVIIFATVLAVIFLTELLSNTVVSTAFFPIAYFISTAQNVPPLILMISVSIASTCAFMTPVATPCNALAFGEMRGTSFRRMILSGLLLNITGALLMSVWLQFVIPLIYH